MALSDELEALAKRHGATSYRNRADTQHPAYGFTEDGLNGLIGEVLAKWGQPAHSGEPVAWLSPWRSDQVTTDYDAYGKHGIPLYTAPQPVEREPLTDEAVDLLCKVGPVYVLDGKVTRTPAQYRDELKAAQRYGLRQGERAHGINKGGQHGTE